MRKKILTVSILTIVIFSLAIVFRQQYERSPDYNYFTAKLDIKNGNIRIIHIGRRVHSSKDKEMDMIAGKYGFKNDFIGYDTTKQKLKGIKNYNETVETYLMLRNGADWKINYEKEIDSIQKTGSGYNNIK